MNLYDATIAAGGGTFHQDGTTVQPTRSARYAVAIRNGVVVPVGDRRGFEAAVSVLGTPVVGTWVHDGAIHVDPVEVLAHPVQAVRAGAIARQIAISDLIARKEITL
jgi:hypothetical protein